MKKFRNGKTEETHVYHAIRENYAINCAIQGACAWFENKRLDWPSVSFFDHWPIRMLGLFLLFALNYLFCTVFEKNCTALNQSKWRNFFMYIINGEIAFQIVNYTILLSRPNIRIPWTGARKKFRAHWCCFQNFSAFFRLILVNHNFLGIRWFL